MGYAPRSARSPHHGASRWRGAPCMSMHARVIDGLLLSPHFIFVRCAGLHSDLELLGDLGASGYRLLDADAREPRNSTMVFITEDQEWTHIADDYWYRLWHLPHLKSAVELLGERYDVFHCRIADADDSHEFTYYRALRLRGRPIARDR